MEPNPRLAVGPAPERLRNNRGCFSWKLAGAAVMLSIIILSSSGMAAYRWKDDPATSTFVAYFFYVAMVLLLYCLWLKEIMRGWPACRDRLNSFLWCLTLLILLCLAYMVMGTASLTLPMALLVWFIVAAAMGIVGALSAFFSRGRINQRRNEPVRPPV